jgi:hypothetical protein
MTGRGPNFFIAGAPKAGTDALYYELDQHPEVYMSPIKEPCYFSSEIRPQNFAPDLRARMEELVKSSRDYARSDMSRKRFGGIISDWDDYLRLFAAVRDEKAIGEGSVCYLWSKSAASAIASRLPNAKIIIVLMDPAERAFAQYRKSVQDGHVHHSFRSHLEASLQYASDKLGLLHPFLEFGRYAEQIERYLKVFPRTQLNISFYEDAVADYNRWFGEILSFLRVDPHFVPGPDERKNERSQQMREEDRSLLVEYYREDIRQLEDLLHCNLSAWLRH